MPQAQDEDIRIYELPEAQELTSGMKVAVDSETDGTKSFDLSNLAGKVDEPETAPEAGQVLTFDGTGNTWANPPEGVYVLNYSEVADIRDVDIEKVKTLPTFLKIDTEQPLTISVPRSSGSSYTVNVQPGTIMGLEEIGANGTSGTYSGPKFLIFGSKFGEEVGGGIMQNADIRVICCIALSAFGGVSKGLTVSGNMDPGGELFGSPSSPGSQPFPITTRFFVGKGPGDPNTNRTQNALGVEFQSAGKIRKQVMMPAEIQDHDFSTDTTPEQIQFMGWGASSSRAGYKNLITAQHNYDSTNYPTQTPQVQFLKFKMSGGTPESDQVMNVVQATMKSADGQNTEVIGGLLVPSITYAGAVLQAWTDSNGSHYGWKPVNEVPSSTSQDEGKVLTVDSNGAPVWTEPPTEIAVFDANYSSPPVPFANYPTFAELNDARLAGKVPIIVQITSTGEHFYYMPTLVNVDENQVKFHFVNPETGAILKLEGPTSNPVWSSTSVVGISSYGTRTESGIVDGVLTIYGGNSLTKLKLTTVQSITVKANEGTPNFALEIDNTDNSHDVSVTVVDFADKTLNSSVSGGSTVGAGKYVQLTCVGNCWTLAEFEV